MKPKHDHDDNCVAMNQQQHIPDRKVYPSRLENQIELKNSDVKKQMMK